MAYTPKPTEQTVVGRIDLTDYTPELSKEIARRLRSITELEVVPSTGETHELYLRLTAEGSDVVDAEANAKIDIHRMCQTVDVAVRL